MTRKIQIQKTPLPNYLKIKKTSTQSGSTIFATKNIPKGRIICTTEMTNMDYHDGCIMSPFGNVFLHSEQPNAEIKVNKENQFHIDIVSIREIESGEEILVNYPNTRKQTLSRNELISILRRNGETIPGTKYE